MRWNQTKRFVFHGFKKWSSFGRLNFFRAPVETEWFIYFLLPLRWVNVRQLNIDCSEAEMMVWLHYATFVAKLRNQESRRFHFICVFAGICTGASGENYPFLSPDELNNLWIFSGETCSPFTPRPTPRGALWQKVKVEEATWKPCVVSFCQERRCSIFKMWAVTVGDL